MMRRTHRRGDSIAVRSTVQRFGGDEKLDDFLLQICCHALVTDGRIPTSGNSAEIERSVEFFVTSKTLDRYFELQWNPLGGVFDAIIDNKLDQQGVSNELQRRLNFTAKGMKSAVKVKGTVGNSDDKDEMWQVEVALPFADLGSSRPNRKLSGVRTFTVQPGEDKPAELLSWSPTRFPVSINLRALATWSLVREWCYAPYA